MSQPDYTLDEWLDASKAMPEGTRAVLRERVRWITGIGIVVLVGAVLFFGRTIDAWLIDTLGRELTVALILPGIFLPAGLGWLLGDKMAGWLRRREIRHYLRTGQWRS